MLTSVTSCLCYKTVFGGNLDFPKIKKWKKGCSDVWTFSKMLKQWILFYKNYRVYLKLFIAFKMASSCRFSQGGNLDFRDFLQKSFLTSSTGGYLPYFSIFFHLQQLKFGQKQKIAKEGSKCWKKLSQPLTSTKGFQNFATWAIHQYRQIRSHWCLKWCEHGYGLTIER